MIGRYLRTERRTGDNAIRKSKEVHPGSIERQRVDNPCSDAVESSESLLTGVVRDECDFSPATDAHSVGRTEAKTARSLEHDAVSDALAWGIELCTTGRASRTGQRSNDDEQGEDSHALDE